MDNIPTIKENFATFVEAEFPGEHPECVTDFIMSAFYAGAGSILKSIDAISRTADTPALGIATLHRLENEVTQYALKRAARCIGELIAGDDGGMLIVHIRRKE